MVRALLEHRLLGLEFSFAQPSLLGFGPLAMHAVIQD